VDTFPEDAITPGENETKFAKLAKAIEKHFNPESNVEFQRYIFRHTEQTTQPIDEYFADLKLLASTCGFANADAEIKSQLIAGCKSQKIRQKGLSTPAMTLTDLLTFARTLELTVKQTKHMTEQTNHLTYRHKQREHRQRPNRHEQQQQQQQIKR
jgi:hypothetical protein